MSKEGSWESLGSLETVPELLDVREAMFESSPTAPDTSPRKSDWESWTGMERLSSSSL